MDDSSSQLSIKSPLNPLPPSIQERPSSISLNTTRHAHLTTFTCFTRLPPEIRFIIWEEALSVWVTCTLFPAPAEMANYNLLLNFLGPAPCLVGRSCKEAWQAMEKSCLQLTRCGPATPSADLPWIDPAKTVVCLGDDMQTAAALAGLCKATLSKLKHVVLVLNLFRFAKVHWLLKHLSSSCPALETLIIDQTYCDGPQGSSAEACYVHVPTYTGPELGKGFMDYPILQILVGRYFKPPLRLHLLGGEAWKTAVCSPNTP